MDEIAYKIVQQTFLRGSGSRLFSYWIDSHSAQVEYRKGKWARPRKGCGPLAAFDTLLNAKEFREAVSGGVIVAPIYECQIARSEERTLWLIDSGGNTCVQAGLPTGTILCTRIKLIKEVA